MGGFAWLGGLALAAFGALAQPAGGAESATCTTGRSVTIASASKTTYVFDKPNQAVRANGVVWRNVAGHALEIEGNQDACFAGGSVHGPYPEDSVYECTPIHCPNRRCPSPCWPYHISAGVSVRVAAPSVYEDVRVSDYGDGFSQERSANRAPWEVRRAYLHDIHDDAVENDWGASVKVVDSLLERVNVAFASRLRAGTVIDARDRTFEVRNNLILLHRFSNQYKMRAGHGGLWKWGHDGMGPRVIITDNVFVAEFPGGGAIFPLVDQVVECRNNLLLWAGSHADWEDELDDDRDTDGLDSRGRLRALSHCYRVIVKPAIQSKAAFLAQHWEPRVAEWKRTHVAAGGAPVPAPLPRRTMPPGARR